MTLILRRKPRTNVLHGLTAPHALRLTIANEVDATDPIDLTTASSASLLVVNRLTGETDTWDCTIDGAPTADELVLVHVYAADNSDIPSPCVLELTAEITTSSGVRVAGPGLLYVQ